MRSWKKYDLILLGLLMGCSGVAPHKVAEKNNQHPSQNRSLASIYDLNQKVSIKSVKSQLKGIYYSYLLGRVRLDEFDKSLDLRPQNAMESDSYYELLSIRGLVDQFEHEICEIYVKLVLIDSLPGFSHEEKKNARDILGVISQFFGGVLDNQNVIPQNLRPMILGRLQEKRSFILEELKSIQKDQAFAKNGSETLKAINEHIMDLSIDERRREGLSDPAKLDRNIFNKTLAKVEVDEEFKAFKLKIKKISKEMKDASKKLSRSRSTSSDSIFPSTSEAGNITGRGFPANTWSLTFDDGPSSKNTPSVLKNLTDRKMKATFFVLAKQVEGFPVTAKSIVDVGMDIASHSYDHPQMTKVTATELEKQTGGAKKILKDKLSKEITLFRLPYGAGVGTPSVRSKIAEHNMIHVFWNVDTLDWNDKDPQSIFERAKKQMAASSKNSGIILFHDTHSQTITASALLMDYLTEKKMKICTVQAVVDQINKATDSCL